MKLQQRFGQRFAVGRVHGEGVAAIEVPHPLAMPARLVGSLSSPHAACRARPSGAVAALRSRTRAKRSAVPPLSRGRAGCPESSCRRRILPCRAAVAPQPRRSCGRGAWPIGSCRADQDRNETGRRTHRSPGRGVKSRSMSANRAITWWTDVWPRRHGPLDGIIRPHAPLWLIRSLFDLLSKRFVDRFLEFLGRRLPQSCRCRCRRLAAVGDVPATGSPGFSGLPDRLPQPSGGSAPFAPPADRRGSDSRPATTC